MRIAALGLAGAIAFALSANAAPIAPVRAHENPSNITKVAGGAVGAFISTAGGAAYRTGTGTIPTLTIVPITATDISHGIGPQHGIMARRTS